MKEELNRASCSSALVETWHRQRRAGVVARVISSQGLGPQGRDEFVVIDADGRTGGAVLGGAVQPELVAATRAATRHATTPTGWTDS